MRQHHVPTVVGKTALGERSYDIYSRLLEDRVVMLGTQVSEEAANIVVAQLIHLEAEDPDKDISLYINSPGGTVYAGLAIYDTMQFIRPDVSTICVGMAMSMSAILLCGGAQGKRFALPNSKIMIHQGSSGTEGSPADVEIHAREILAQVRRAAEIVARHSRRDADQVAEDMQRDFFMTAEQARAYGLIDDILTPRKSPRMVGFVPGLPGAPGNGRERPPADA